MTDRYRTTRGAMPRNYQSASLVESFGALTARQSFIGNRVRDIIKKDELSNDRIFGEELVVILIIPYFLATLYDIIHV